MESKLLKQNRAAILEKRLEVLAAYIESQVASPSEMSFADFVKRNGISKEDFVKDLPDSLKNPPAGGKAALTDYMNKMNDLYIKQQSFNADGVV
ncbi:MAG: hypothetical protein AABY22_20985, partial [Nanoarchaeota archaeon]